MRRITAYIDTEALRHNFRLLQHHAAGATVMAVVKADAYGHGLACCLPPLLAEGCRSFAVTDAGEGQRLRQLLPERITTEVAITLLAGVTTMADAVLCRQHRLSPVVIDERQITLLHQAEFGGAVWIKADTGMNRTGAEAPLALYRMCHHYGLTVAGLLSHLACADTPEHPLNAQQCARFQHILAELPAGTPASLLNSAGVFTLPQHRFQVVRPGIALYGVEPCEDRVMGLIPVMRLLAPVVQTRLVHAGEGIGYGSSFIANRSMNMAVIAAGYGDGIPRSLSHRGTVYIQGQACPIVGRVCMDYCMVDMDDLSVDNGEAAVFWDADHPVAAVADMQDTIAYELLTRIGSRVPRIPSPSSTLSE